MKSNSHQNLVDIVMVTYNQEDYIEEAIKSVLLQDVDFGIRLILCDDASIDTTSEICKKFAKSDSRIEYTRNEKNLGLVKNYEIAFKKCKAKYIAILEGDDYWIDKNKLKKQVAILDKYPDYGVVHTGASAITPSGDVKKHHLGIPSSLLHGELYLKLVTIGNNIIPMTVIFRKNLFDKEVNYSFFVENDFKTIDYPIWLALSRVSRFYYLDEITAMYRLNPISVSRSANYVDQITFVNTAYKIREYHWEKHLKEMSIDKNNIFNPVFKKYIEVGFTYKKYRETKKYLSLFNPSTTEGKIIKYFASNYLSFHIYHYFIKSKPILSKIKQSLFKIRDTVLNSKLIYFLPFLLSSFT